MRTAARRTLWVFVVLLVALAAVLALGAIWLTRQIDPGDPGAVKVVTISEGSDAGSIASKLADEGVVSNATVFEYYARWKGAGTFLAGSYELAERSAMDDVIAALEAGPPPPPVQRITVPEGLWLDDIAEIVLSTFPEMDRAELEAALGTVRSRYQPAGADLEGLLFPATYDVAVTDVGDEEALVRQMVDAFDHTADELGLSGAASRLAGVAGNRTIGPYEAIVVASMIEEETAIASERPKVARVIYNRLQRGERLGIDATVLYAIGEHKETLLQSDLEVDSPYNTRRYAGLPPGPISAPSRESLQAALAPAEGPWLFYVLTETDGTHHFTDDYQDFLRAAQDARDRGVF